MADTAETASVTARPLTSRATSSAPMCTAGAAGSVPTRRSSDSVSAITRAASSGSMPARSTASVTARYIAPVSR
jgi:hypothetical protein